VVAKRFGRWLSGDHVLPLKVIKDALVRAGVSKNSKLYQEVMAFAHSPKNLRLMDRSLNSSKGALNAVRWSKTPQGSLVPRKYIQNVLRKQYKNAQELNDILNKGLGTNKDWFQGFFK
ncbi:MAG TPA: hypothetical protein PKA76_19745, partial [Pirellulaceae bacterium]|nr:hypothetical protein [Pirellulaceae bacterium]